MSYKAARYLAYGFALAAVLVWGCAPGDHPPDVGEGRLVDYYTGTVSRTTWVDLNDPTKRDDAPPCRACGRNGQLLGLLTIQTHDRGSYTVCYDQIVDALAAQGIGSFHADGFGQGRDGE